jgi:hypothetical protein
VRARLAVIKVHHLTGRDRESKVSETNDFFAVSESRYHGGRPGEAYLARAVPLAAREGLCSGSGTYRIQTG